MVKRSMILFVIFTFHIDMCVTRITDLERRNTNKQSEAEKAIEFVTKAIDCLIEKQHSAHEIQALKDTIRELQRENDEMKTELNKMKTTCASSSKSVENTPTTITTSTTTPTTTKTAESTKTSSQLTPTCSDGWSHFNGYCYRFSGERKIWASASFSCQNRGGYLAEIITDAELDFFYDFISPYYRFAHFFWLGATDRKQEGTFVYEHSKQEVPEKFWKYDQIEDVKGVYHCVYMSRINGEFYHEGCYWKFYFVCQKPITSLA